MPIAVFVSPDGARHEVPAPLGRSLMQIAQDHAVPGILGDCGGSCSCATCHGYHGAVKAAAKGLVAGAASAQSAARVAHAHQSFKESP